MNCHRCGKPEFIDVSGLCRTIQQCQKCDEDVCSDCADVDADYQGEEDGYRLSQWACKQKCEAATTEEAETVAA